MVQFLAKFVEPFIIYHKVKYLTFDFDLKVTKLLFFYLGLYGYYMVQFLAKLTNRTGFMAKLNV